MSEDLNSPAFLLAMMRGQRWPLDATTIRMGAEWEFDYADLPSDQQSVSTRITRCYEISATALVHSDAVRSKVEKEGLPSPEVLIHGRWSSPNTRDKPIPHAWVLLSDGHVWEPITKTLCDPVRFASYTQCVSARTYDREAALHQMVTTGHYGGWS